MLFYEISTTYSYSSITIVNRRYDWADATPLWYAANYGNFTKCKNLLRRNADPNIGDDNNVTPLSLAAVGGYLEICDLLLKYGADPNIVTTWGTTPLTVAVKNNHFDVCKYLILNTNVEWSKVEKYFGDILCLTSKVGDLEICQKIIQSNPAGDINKKNSNHKIALAVAAEHEHFQVLEFLMEKGAKVTTESDVYRLYNFCKREVINLTKIGNNFVDILCIASKVGDLKMCQTLIQSYPGEDLKKKNIHGLTALNAAVENEQFKVIGYLLTHGATWDDIHGTFGEHGLSPFYYVCGTGDMDLVKKYVQEYGVNVNSKRCLAVAAEHKHFQVLEYLMEKGAKVSTESDVYLLYNFCKRDVANLTKVGKNFIDILCYASQVGNLEMCQKLIQSNLGEDLNKKNIKNKTALIVAVDHEEFLVIGYLLTHGATWDDIHETVGEHGLSPFYYVCGTGDMVLVKKYVQEYDADVNSKRCLSVAVEQENYDVFEFLLSQGANINEHQSIDGKHLLYLLCNNGQLDLTKKCVENYEADVNAEGCLAVALEFYHHEIGQYLIDKGCKVDQVKN